MNPKAGYGYNLKLKTLALSRISLKGLLLNIHGLKKLFSCFLLHLIRSKVLRRDVKEGVEFMVMKTWKSMESIKEFAKNDIDKAVVAIVAQPFFKKYDDHISHFIMESELD